MAVFCGRCGQPAATAGGWCGRCGALLPSPVPTDPTSTPTVLAWPSEAAHSNVPVAGPNAGHVGGTGIPPQRSTPTALLAGLAALALVAAGALVYLLVVRPRQQQQSTAPVTVVVTATRPATNQPDAASPPTGAGRVTTGSIPTGPPASSAPTASAPPTYPALTLTGKLCASTGTGPWASTAAGNPVTSCPFAVTVQAAYLAAVAGASSAPATPVTITAHSPVTNKDYVMTCTGDQPVACTGGNNAVVYLFGGAATFLP